MDAVSRGELQASAYSLLKAWASAKSVMVRDGANWARAADPTRNGEDYVLSIEEARRILSDEFTHV
jgi:hypothetical protein